MGREHLLKGAEREGLVAVAFLKLGFEVFTAFGTGMSCDMVVSKHGFLLRVEVKGPRHGGARRNYAPAGPVASLGHGSKASNCTLFDIHVTVLDTGELAYNRSIHHTINAASAELPLREEYSNRTTKKNLSRAQRMETTC